VIGRIHCMTIQEHHVPNLLHIMTKDGNSFNIPDYPSFPGEVNLPIKVMFSPIWGLDGRWRFQIM